MGGTETQLTGPDLTQGIAEGDLADAAMLLGHARGEPVLVARVGDDVFAIGATCTHYGGPLAEGLLDGETVRCPWHHSCFSLRTGSVLRPPALNDVTRWQVERRDGRLYVTDKLPAADAPHRAARRDRRGAYPERVVALGAGAAGDSVAETLRRDGYDGQITLIDPDEGTPYDRPNLSKDYLAGNAPEEWIPLHPRSFYDELGVELLRRRVTAIDLADRTLRLDDGGVHRYDALVIATGAEPVRLPASVDPDGRVRYLRTLADSRAIIDAASRSRRAVVLGASFIGLEVAASLRARGLEVHVVAPEARPLERILGSELGDFVRALHEEHGVVFHLGRTASRVDGSGIALDDGDRIEADLVIAGIGVRPRVELASAAGLDVERGILVNEYLETSAPGVWAAGDVAAWPEPRSGERVRIEHWVVAQCMGQAVARNILGARRPFDVVPFFWSAHYDVIIDYVGYAPRWDRVEVDGRIEQRDCAVRYRRDNRVLALATIFRDRESLETERAMEGEISEERDRAAERGRARGHAPPDEALEVDAQP